MTRGTTQFMHIFVHLLTAFTRPDGEVLLTMKAFFLPAPKRALVNIFLGFHLAPILWKKLILRFIFIIAFVKYNLNYYITLFGACQGFFNKHIFSYQYFLARFIAFLFF